MQIQLFQLWLLRSAWKYACRNPLLYHNSHVSPCEDQIGMIEVRHLHVVRGDAKDSANMLRRYRTIVLHPQDFYILLF